MFSKKKKSGQKWRSELSDVWLCPPGQKTWGCLVCRRGGCRGSLDILEESPSSDGFTQPLRKGAQEVMPLRAPEHTENFQKWQKSLPLQTAPQGRSLRPSSLWAEDQGSCQAPHELLMSIIAMDWIWATWPHNEPSLISSFASLAQDPSALPVVSSLARMNNYVVYLDRKRENPRHAATGRKSAVLTRRVFVCVSPVCSKWSDSKSLKEKQRQKHIQKRAWAWLRRWTPPRKRRRRSARG